MSIKINNQVIGEEPWNFVVEIDGQPFATRQPLIRDLQMFEEANKSPTKLVELAKGLFLHANDAIAFEKQPMENMAIVVMAWLKEATDRAAKKTRAMAQSGLVGGASANGTND